MSIKPAHNEITLLHQVAQGNQEAFADLFQAYHQSLAAYVFRITESMEMTEDIVQDVFIKLWLKREILPGLTSFTNYLFILCRNYTFRCLRKKATDHQRNISWGEQFEETTGPADDNNIGDTYRALIDAAIAQLPPQQQKVYFLSRHEGMKHAEIAAQLGITAETSKKHMKLALRSITAYVHGHMDTVILLILLTPITLP
ncbi:RNA polymerase sigma factor [Chitinophaga defluvii]|uniref:RNA polymerase sigma-70 factor n=1 Tax=Chitinophaga defluvii TaxID=3163343 RepID=A0ABV2T1S4_9BACT